MGTDLKPQNIQNPIHCILHHRKTTNQNFSDSLLSFGCAIKSATSFHLRPPLFHTQLHLHRLCHLRRASGKSAVCLNFCPKPIEQFDSILRDLWSKECQLRQACGVIAGLRVYKVSSTLHNGYKPFGREHACTPEFHPPSTISNIEHSRGHPALERRQHCDPRLVGDQT